MSQHEPQQATSKKWKKKILFHLIFIAALCIILTHLVSSFLTRVAIKVPNLKHPELTPTDFELDYENITFDSEDNIRLSGWWLANGIETNPTIVIIHGLGASKAHMLDHIAFFQKSGYPVLALDLRGHGNSQESLTTIGYYEQRDAIAALRFLKTKKIDHAVLWGTSLGAVIAIHVAALELGENMPNIVGVIADAPFDTLRQTIAHHGKLMYGLPSFPFITLTYPKIEKAMQFDIDDVDCLKAAAKINAPILLLAAEEDHRMPVPIVQSIYDAATEPKKIWIIPHQGHDHREFTPALQETILTFLKDE